MDIREHSFMERVVRHWNRLARTVVESSSLQELKSCMDVALVEMVQWWPWQSCRSSRT